MLSYLQRNFGGIAAVLFYAALALWSSQHPPQQQHSKWTAQGEQAANSNKNQTIISTPSMQVTVSGGLYVNAADKAAEGSAHKSETPQGFWEWFTKFLTDIKITDALLALFTFLVAVYTAQLKDVTKDVHEATVAGQRAYVAVLAPQAELRFDQARNLIALRVWVTWKNSGTTPAAPMTGLIGATWVPAVDQFVWGQANPQNVAQPFVLGPGAEIPTGHIDIAPGHAAATLSGGGHQFVWGWAKYRDIFPNSPEHVVEFCFQLSIEGELTPVQNACTSAHGLCPRGVARARERIVAV